MFNIDAIDKKIDILLNTDGKVKSNIRESTQKDLEISLSNPQLINVIKTILESKGSLTYEQLCEIVDTFEKMGVVLRDLQQKAELDIFLKDGYTLDIKGLRNWYNSKRIKKEYPNLNIERIVELYKKPPRTLKTYYSDKEKIYLNPFVFRKWLIGIIQMIFNKMDLVAIYTGAEGCGKSTKCSQDILLLHWLLTETGIINYKYEINEMFLNTIERFQEKEDKYFKEKFRVLALDEGNELHRQNWREEKVQTFFQRMRRERHNQRIKLICIPVLGEMMTSIIQNRVNFVFNGKMRNDVKTGMLLKGFWDMIIIPRGSKIYSPQQRREITGDEIRTRLHENLKDQNYRKGLDNSLIAKKFKTNGTWGFKEEEYIKNLKDTNEVFSVNRGINFGVAELFNFYKSNVTLKKIGIKYGDLRYSSLYQMINKINKYFEKQPDLLSKYEAAYKRKLAEREE